MHNSYPRSIRVCGINQVVGCERHDRGGHRNRRRPDLLKPGSKELSCYLRVVAPVARYFFYRRDGNAFDWNIVRDIDFEELVSVRQILKIDLEMNHHLQQR